MRSSHILIIQRDLMCGLRCCVERVCLDAATGRLSGEGVFLYQSQIKASAGKERVLSVCLDLMIRPVPASPAAAVVCVCERWLQRRAVRKDTPLPRGGGGGWWWSEASSPSASPH